MKGSEPVVTADNDSMDKAARHRAIRRTAIVLGLIAFGWYIGFMALRLM